MEEKGYTRLTGSGEVTPNAVVLDSVIVTPDGTNASYCQVRRGRESTAPIIATLRVGASESREFNSLRGILCLSGVYVTFGTNLAEIVVTFCPVRGGI